MWRQRVRRQLGGASPSSSSFSAHAPPGLLRAASTVAAARARKTKAQTVPRRETLGRLSYDASKAGLGKVDKAAVQATIDALSKGSSFYKSEQKKSEAREARIASVLARVKQYEALKPEEKAFYVQKAIATASDLEAQRDLSHIFLHVDMDMFYAAVEERQDPTLHDRPFAVGTYAMLTTSNYIARQYGVRSGMPGFIAKKLCPDLWIVPTNFPLYEQEAVVIRSIAARYDPTFVSVGLDEVTMDITDYLAKENAKRQHQRKPPLTAADVSNAFRAEVLKQTGLTCSAGISSTAAFAKLASNVNKPNGQHELVLRTREDVFKTISAMPVRDVPGVGGYTEALLHAMGIRSCGDIGTHSALICFLFKEKTASFYLSIGLGTVRTHVDRTKAERAAQAARVLGSALKTKPTRAVSLSTSSAGVPLPKSISKSRTFARGFKSEEDMRVAVQALLIQVHDGLLQHRARAALVTFFTTSHAFKHTSASKTLERPTRSYAHLLQEVTRLADAALRDVANIRLIGVRVSKLDRSAAGEAAAPRTSAMQRPMTRRGGVTARTLVRASAKTVSRRKTVV